MRFVALIIVAGVVVSCASSEAVHLRKPAGGLIVQCGPYNGGGIGPIADIASQNRLRDCVADYQRQGFERIP